MQELQINTVDTLIISIGVLFVGNILTRRISFLAKYSISQAVSGGLLGSLQRFDKVGVKCRRIGPKANSQS